MVTQALSAPLVLLRVPFWSRLGMFRLIMAQFRLLGAKFRSLRVTLNLKVYLGYSEITWAKFG